MKKKKLANLVAFIIGLYFIIRSFFLYTCTDGAPSQNEFFALIYFCFGMVAIIIQIIVNFLMKRNNNNGN